VVVRAPPLPRNTELGSGVPGERGHHASAWWDSGLHPAPLEKSLEKGLSCFPSPKNRLLGPVKMRSRAERGHYRSGLVRRHPAVGVVDMGGCPVTAAASLQRPATCGELFRVCCAGQDCWQHSRSHAGNLGGAIASPAGRTGTTAPASEAWSRGAASRWPWRL